MVNKTTNSTSHDDRLDSFLTTIESKLRGPFSSLDLSKAVSTAAGSSRSTSTSTSTTDNPSDDNDPARKYLDDLSAVFRRTNKVIQCRMLIGLLGLNDIAGTDDANNDNDDNIDNDNAGGQYLTPEILRILHETQEGPIHEEWVRTTSGLVEGVMFRTREHGNTRESCRGDEAARIIRDTGTEVCEKVERQIQNVGRPHSDGKQGKEQTPAAGATAKAKATATDTEKTIKAERGGGSSEEKKKPNVPTSAATANKRNRGFIIEKVKKTSSQPAIKKEEQLPPAMTIKPEQPHKKTNLAKRTEPIPPDLNACFAPYRYRLIPTPILNTIVPEFEFSKEKSNGNDNSKSNPNGVSDGNCHFRVNASANILQIDLRLETQRAKEHGSGHATKPSAQTGMNGLGRTKNDSAGGLASSRSGGAFGKPALPPGFAKAKKKRISPLFNTTKQYRPTQVKTMRRKPGGAQALLKSNATASGGGAILNKLGGGGGGGSGVGGTTGGRMGIGRTRPSGAGRFSGGAAQRSKVKSSRMKMIDDDDVDTLTKLQQSNATSNMTAAELRASKRKRILEKARGTSSGSGGIGMNSQQRSKKQKVASRARPGIQRLEPTTATAMATTTTTAVKTEPQQPQQQHLQLQQQQPPPQTQTPESWQSLLRDRSNKMSSEDKIRAQSFFTTTNPAERSALLSPSEGGPVYKMKIHEQRGKDPATGQDIKETFYLELDYNTGAYGQSRKVKRY